MTGALGADGRSRVTAAIFFGIALTSMGAPQVLLASSGAVYLLAFHGPGMLPAVYVGAALILFPIGWAASIVSRRFSPAGAMVCITVFRAVVALALFIATQMGEGAAVGVLAPIWARVDVILGLVALWRLAGKTFDAADDRKWLMWIAACEPVSSIAAGLFAPLLLRFVDVSAMFLLAAIILAAAAPPLMLIRTELADRAARGRRGGRTRRPAAVRPLSPSMRRYLALVVAAMVLWTVAHYHLDTLFHVELRAAHETPADMFSYFARTLAGAGLVGAGLAALWQGQFLRNHGMRTLLILLPVALVALILIGLTARWAFTAPDAVFAAVTVMVVVETALVTGFYTRAWRSMLAPLPETHRDRLVNVLNRNVHAIGAVAGAGAIAWLDLSIGLEADVIALIFIVVSLLGLMVSFFVQRSFAAALERALVRRQTFEAFDVGGSDRRSREVIQRMLRQGDAKSATEAARIQAALDVEGFVHMAPPMIARGERDVVRALLDTVREVARPELYPPMAGRLTVEEDPGLRDALLTAAAATGHPRSPRLLARSIAETPETPPLGALIGLGRHGGDYGAAVARQFLERYALKGDAELDRALDAAREIGPNAPTGPVAVGLRSGDPAIRRKAIRAAGKMADPSLANLLVDQLSDPREWRAATLALTALGEGAVPALAEVVGDRAAPLKQRAAALRALGDIDEPAAREQLLLHAVGRDERLQTHAHLALWRSGAAAPREQAQTFLDFAREEARAAAEMALAARRFAAEGRSLLAQNLSQQVKTRLIASIRAAGLTRQRPDDLARRLSATFGAARDWRDAEVCASLLPDDLQTIFRCAAAAVDHKLDDAERPGATATLAAFADAPEDTAPAWRARIFGDARWTSDWLQAVAYHEAAPHERPMPDRMDAAGPLLRSITAASADTKGDPSMALNTVERVLVLKTADIFAQVPDEDLAEIAPYLTPIYLDPGETIIKEGEHGDELYMVVAGEVKVMRDGEEVARKGERWIFGDLSALDPEPRSATVIATAPTQLLSLSNEHLLALFEANVEIAAGVITSLVRRLRSGF